MELKVFDEEDRPKENSLPKDDLSHLQVHSTPIYSSASFILIDL
jgi:hypothetical protein